MKDNHNQDLIAGEAPGISAQSLTNQPRHILVVDEDASIRHLSTEVLIRHGYEVDAAGDGAAAWEALNAGSYDLLITDNNLPTQTGVKLLKKLRAARTYLPVILATGTLPTAKFTHSPWLKPAATLLQPYTSEKMLRTVKKVLRAADRTAASAQLFVPREMQDKGSPPTGELSAERRLHPAHSAHRILVVDDDHDLRRLYVEALAGARYHVDGAADGAAGWEALRAGSYHLLITENDVPKLTGVELVRRLRAARMALPVVMAAARLPTHELARNSSLQLAATLLKPFPVDELLHTVDGVLRATTPLREQPDPTTVGQGQPSAGGWQL